MLKRFSKQKTQDYSKKYENYERKKFHWYRQTYNKGRSITYKAYKKVQRQK